jgi:hypothetical protein
LEGIYGCSCCICNASSKNKFLFFKIGGINLNLSSISQYLASYLYHNGNEGIEIKDTFFLMPIAVFCVNLTASLGGYIEGKYGARMYD